MRSDETVVEVMRHLNPHGYLAGGYVRWMMSDSAIDFGDADVWCPRFESFDKMRGIMASAYNMDGHEQPYSWDYYFETPERNVTISIIKPISVPGRVMFGSPNQVIAKFDLSFLRGWSMTGQNMPTWESRSDLIDAWNDTIRVVNITSYLGNMRRLQKYIRKGFTVPDSEWIKLAEFYKENGYGGQDTVDSTSMSAMLSDGRIWGD